MSKKNEDIILSIIKSTAKEIVEQLKDSNMIKKEMNYYKKVELLLYNYQNLKEAVQQKDEDIEMLDRYGLSKKSKSVVIYSPSTADPEGDRLLELREKYKREKQETLRDIERIDNALNKIKKDHYFDIIRLKYLEAEHGKAITDEEIAEKLNRDRTTVIRNKKRLINKLITILFPASLREII